MAYVTKNAEILALFTATGKELPHEGSNLGRAVDILQTICDSQSHTIPEPNDCNEPDDLIQCAHYYNPSDDIFEVLEIIENAIGGGEDDFNLEFDGAEYRLIKSDEETIWPIYRDAIKDIVEDCYSDVIKLDKIPSFIAVSIDWEQTAQNAYVDGYGHTFSGYDGSEEESAGYYIFRTN